MFRLPLFWNMDVNTNERVRIFVDFFVIVYFCTTQYFSVL